MSQTGTEKEFNLLLNCIRYGELKVDWAAIDKKNGSQNKESWSDCVSDRFHCGRNVPWRPIYLYV
jgi:hypothetical protein